ncbi:hypothetical protein A2U01_0054385, partial [Trifolium medium]|nr:hypothetical protein [Trifolium medium]
MKVVNGGLWVFEEMKFKEEEEASMKGMRFWEQTQAISRRAQLTGNQAPLFSGRAGLRAAQVGRNW